MHHGNYHLLRTVKRMNREESISWLEKIKEKYIHGGDEKFDECRKTAIDMAIELLKEQQPRVLSKREAYDLPDETDVWCEQRDSKRVAAMTTLGEKYFMHTPLFAMGLESNDIRFWTKRPTEEQRKVVPWETH